MTKTIAEYNADIKANLTTAEALCADLRKLRGLKKLAEGISDGKSLVNFDDLDKTVTDKEAELKKVRAELQKARRIVKKMEEIEAIETGKAPAKAQKPAKKPAAKSDSTAAKKPTSKKAGQPKVTKSEDVTAA